MMSSWSPPAYLKSNGEVGNGGTLIQTDSTYDYAGFADYWYDSIQDYIAHGITPTWISIQNEPDWTAQYASCRFNPSEDPWNGESYASYALALEAVHQRLQSMASPPKLLGPEDVGLHGNAGTLQDFMKKMDANNFYGVAHHLYGGSTDGSADGYNSVFINRSTTSPATVTLDTGSFAYDDSSVYQTAGDDHFISLGSIAGSQLTLPVSSLTTIVLDEYTPLAPTGLTAIAGNRTVTLNWDANTKSDLTGYNVYRSESEGGPYTPVNAELVTASDYTDDTVTNWTTYYYVVTAVDTDRNESSYSNEESAQPNDGSMVPLLYIDFESDLGGWINLTSGEDTDDWTRHSGGTPSPSTGPSGGANGSTWYAYFETSLNDAYTAGDTAILESPQIDAYNLTFRTS